MKYLIDTNVVSALSPRSREARPALASWLEARSSGVYLSVVTASEIRDGIAKARREGATRKAAEIETWWLGVETSYADRLLVFDLKVATITGALLDRVRGAGGDAGFADAAIAATALAGGQTLVTLNGRHFKAMGVSFIDPLVEGLH